MPWKKAIPTEILNKIVTKLRQKHHNVVVSAQTIEELIQQSTGIDDAVKRIRAHYAWADAQQLEEILEGIF